MGMLLNRYLHNIISLIHLTFFDIQILGQPNVLITFTCQVCQQHMTFRAT